MGIIMRKFHLETSGDLVSGSFRSWQITLPVKTNWEKGGYENVYREMIGDSMLVAVKSLKDGNALGDEIQFQSEVELINLSVLHHTNWEASGLSLHD